MDHPMNQIACSYAALRFMPYRETGEFANVGVVVWAPTAGFIGHRCHRRLGRRIRGFFPELELDFYRAAVDGAEALLHAVAQKFAGRMPHEALVQRFHELVRTREGLMTFGPPGAILAASPEQALTDLHQRLVLRQFAQRREYQEQVMRRRLAACLRAWDLSRFYQQDRVGDERFHVEVPFVHRAGDRISKILRPLDLDRDETTEIYRHGDAWAGIMRRLQHFSALPEQVVIPVRLPEAEARRAAAQQVMEDFRSFNATVIPIDDQDGLRRAVVVR
jgi:hypothetical protein